jgi:nucleotide-binding universal stress UspA family protein
MESEKAFTGIVVGVDGSPLSVKALRWAARLEPVVGGPIVAATVWQLPATSVMGAYPSLEWSPENDATELLKQALEEAYGDSVPAGLTTVVASGAAAHVLIENSREARLLIVGSRGLGGFMGLLLGSVSAACAEHAHCPVLVLHAPEDSKSEPTTSTAATGAIPSA